jgi:hypothetical protein
MSVHHRVEARDRGLDRVSRLTSLTLGGGLVLSGGFAVLAGHAYAGHSRRVIPPGAARVASRTGVANATGSGLAPATTTTVAPLGAPQTAPQAAPQTAPPTAPQTVPQYYPPQTIPQYYPPPPPVVSGGS